MTCGELETAVDAYFQKHLDASFWAGLSPEQRAGALAMAVSDILGLIPGSSLDSLEPGSLLFKAIAEQAVFLARNYGTMTDGRLVSSQTIDGVSETYVQLNSSSASSRYAGLSFRAVAFLKALQAASGSGGTVRVARG